MGIIEQFVDPRTATILRIAFGKILQRAPLSLCMLLSIALVTYTLTFGEMMAEGGGLVFVLLLTTLLAITTSFALEYDTKDELMVLINLGVSPTDIFRLGLFRVLALSLLGYVIGVIVVLIVPLSSIRNVMLFYAFLIASALGVLPPLYSSLKSMHVSLLGRVAFKPLMEREVPVLLSPSEVDGVKNYIVERLKDRQDIIIVSLTERQEDIVLICRYLGDFGRETFAMLTSLGINPDEALKGDDTLPLVTVKICIKEGETPILDSWEGENKSKKKSAVALSLQALIRQLLIEYKVYKGRLKGAEFRV